MRNSSEIARYIAFLLDKKDMKPIDLAKKIGVDRSTISRYLSGARKIHMDDVPKIADGLGVSPVELLLKDEDLSEAANVFPVAVDMVDIPIIGTIACGDPITAEENLIGYKQEPSDSLPTGNVFYLVAKGDSMEPTIPDNSYVLIREQSEVEYGQVAAVLINGETEATLKRVKKQGDTMLLIPDNSKHEPIIVNADNPARVIGKAIRYTQDL